MRTNPHSQAGKAGQITQMSRSPLPPASLQKQDGGLAMTFSNRFLAEFTRQTYGGFTLEHSEGLEMTCGLFYKANSSIEKKNILFDLLKFFLQRFLQRGKIVAFQRPETDIRRKADRNFSMEARMTRRVRNKKIVKGFVFWLFAFSLLFFFCPLLISGCNDQEAEIDRVRSTPAGERKAALLTLLDRRFENPEAHFELGQLYQAERLWSRAEYHYNIALSFAPTNRQTQAAMVKVLLDSGETAKAETYADVYMSQVTGSASGSLRLGLAFQNQQLDEYALACYQRALRLAPNSAEIHKQVGYYYLSKSDKVRAKEYLTRSFELDPGQPEVAGELGRLGVEVRIPQETEKLDKIVEESAKQN